MSEERSSHKSDQMSSARCPITWPGIGGVEVMSAHTNLQMSELVHIHYFLGKTTKNRLELAKDLGGLTGHS